MIKLFKMQILFILIFTFLGLNSYSPPPLSAEEGITEKIENEKKELEKLKAQIEERRKKSKEAAKKERSILWNIEEIDYKLGIMKKELRLLDYQLKKKEGDIVFVNTEINGLKKEIDKKSRLLKERLRVVYKNRTGGYLQILFASKDYSTLMRRYKYIKLIVDREAELINSYKDSLNKINNKKIELEKGKEEILYYKGNLTDKEEEIRAEREKKVAILKEVRTEKELYDKLVKELEESASQLSKMIDQLSAAKDKEPVSLSGRFKEEMGRLRWPINGNIAGYFGKQKHPKFNTFIVRKGIDIAAREGDKIKAVFSGKVVYADWFKGYGMLIILDHDEGYYTVYGNASRLLVSSGDYVAKDHVIAEAGDTGISREGNLYFEIRYKGEPQDPMKWLVKR